MQCDATRHFLMVAICGWFLFLMSHVAQQTFHMKESQQASVTLLLVGAPELGILLECSYSGTLALDWGIVFELTCTALQFQFQPDRKSVV